MRAAALAAVLAFATPAAAADPAPAAPAAKPSPLALEVARCVLPRATWEKLMGQAAGAATAAIRESVQGRFVVAPEFEDRLRAEYVKMMPYEEMVAMQAGFLGRSFSAGELKQLLAFYRSPVGRKSVEAMPEAMREALALTQRVVGDRMPEALERLSPLVRPVSDAPQAGGPDAPPTAEKQPAAAPAPTPGE